MDISAYVAGRPVEAVVGSRSWPGVAQAARWSSSRGVMEVEVAWPGWNQASQTSKPVWISYGDLSFPDEVTARPRRLPHAAGKRALWRAAAVVDSSQGSASSTHAQADPTRAAASKRSAQARSPTTSGTAQGLRQPSLGMCFKQGHIGAGRKHIVHRRSCLQ